VDAPNQPTDYTYDTLDNLTGIYQTAPYVVTQYRAFKYDSLSHLIAEKSVEATADLNDAGTKVTSGGSWTNVYVYNSFGLLTDGYDARGVHTQMTYDGLNRVTQVAYSGEATGQQTPTATYTYDERANTTDKFNLGHLTTLSTASTSAAPSTTLTFDYDKMGRTWKEQQTIGTNGSLSSQTYAIQYAFNLAGPTGLEIQICFDADDGEHICVPIDEYFVGGSANAPPIGGDGTADLTFATNSRFAGLGLGAGQIARAGVGPDEGAEVVAEAVRAALQVDDKGCYDPSIPNSDVSAKSRLFDNVDHAVVYYKNWASACSVHSENARESKPLIRYEVGADSSSDLGRSMLPPRASLNNYSLVLKYYQGEGMAVTANTDSTTHVIAGAEFLAGGQDVNVRFARQFLKDAPRCKH
jgi:hypothetical protein